MIKRYTRKLSAAFLALALLCFAVPFIAAADEGEGMEPNFISDAGIKYHLEGPDTMVVELDLLGEHTITLTDGEEGTIEWNYDVPGSVIGSYPDSFTYGPATFSRTIYIVIANNLVMQYSREAFESGEQFLTGVLTQHIVAYERLSSSWPTPVSYNFDQVELVISELTAGNFECIAEGSLPISFSVTSDRIVNSFNPTNLTFLNTRYDELELVSDYAQQIGITPDFIISIIEDPVIIDEVIEQIVETTPAPSAVPEVMIEAAEEVQVQAEEIIEEYQPIASSPAAAAAGAVASTLAVGLAGAAAAVVSGASAGASGAAASGAAGVSNALSGAAAGISQAAQTLAQGSAAASGSVAFTFIKDIITGLRDMLMDEGRSQASGWVTENLKK